MQQPAERRTLSMAAALFACLPSLASAQAVATVDKGDTAWMLVAIVVVTLAWSGVAALLAFAIAKVAFGLCVHHDAEREGLDISSHGESAYEL